MDTMGFSMKSSTDYIITATMLGISDQQVNEYNNDELTHHNTVRNLYYKCPFIPDSRKLTSVFETLGLFISSLN